MVTNKSIVCNLVIDEIAIKQQIEYRNSQWYGYVDYGTNADSNFDFSNVPQAKNALFFLLVGLNDNFKVPLAYFLVSSFTGKEQANLIHIALQLTEDFNVHVHSITLDGTNKNITTVNALGADINFESPNFKPNFLHPTTKEKVFIFLDPSHMVKNARNALGATLKFNKIQNCTIHEPLFDEEKNMITWKHIIRLHELQNKEGLILANKLSDRHIKYYESIMNVKLAVQVLSKSVHDSLLHLKSINQKGFENIDGTAKYCEIINNIFDMLNCRKLFPKKNIWQKYSIPLCQENEEELKNFAVFAEKYLKNLKTIHNIPLTKYERKCAFIGFIVCLRNVIDFYYFLKSKYGIEYLLTYKLLQDMIENLFSTIRCRGGYSNNPTSYQLIKIVRRLITHHHVVYSEYGNCIMDDVPILTVSSSLNNNINDFKDNDISEIDVHSNSDIMKEIPFNLSEIQMHIVSYMTGYLCRTIMKQKKFTRCLNCKTFLINPDPVKNSNLYSFINLKSNGRLIYPSIRMVNIVIEIESFIRDNEHIQS